MALEHIASGAGGAALPVIIYAIFKATQWLIGKGNKSETTIQIDKGDYHTLSHQQEEELHAIFIYATEQKIQQEYLRADVRSIKEGQENLAARITDLIVSNQKVSDKITDLINLLEKVVDRINK